MISLREAIVVEGRYDVNTLRQLVDAPVFETGGFGIFHDKKLLGFLRGVAEKRGLIILTDSDGAGFVIRSYLSGALPREKVLHAYIPDIPGKERRKKTPGREGKLGVEGMRPEVLLQALRRAGASLGQSPVAAREELTKAEFYALGFSGGNGSQARRQRLLHRLELPERMSSNALLQALNVMYDKEELLLLLKENYD